MGNKVPTISNALHTISALKKVNREQVDRMRDYYMLKKLNETYLEEIERLRYVNEQLELTIKQYKERLYNYEM